MQGVFESIILRKSPDNKDNSDAGQTTQSIQYHTANDSDTVLYVTTGNEETLLNENGQNGPAEADYDADLDEKHEQDDDDDITKLQEPEDLNGKTQCIWKLAVKINTCTNRNLFLKNSHCLAGDQSTYLVTRINMPHKDLFLVTTPR